jgi:hypothetical protein
MIEIESLWNLRERSKILLRVVAVSVLAAICATGCAGREGESDTNFQTLFVAKDAARVRNDRIGSNEQISFTVSRQFPEIDMTEAKIQLLRDSNWIGCTGRNSDWDSFVDKASDSRMLIHQRVLYFKKNSSFVMYSVRYRSSLEPDDKGVDRSKPRSNEQHVVVQKMNLNDSEMKPLLDSFGVKC